MQHRHGVRVRGLGDVEAPSMTPPHAADGRGAAAAAGAVQAGNGEHLSGALHVLHVGSLAVFVHALTHALTTHAHSLKRPHTPSSFPKSTETRHLLSIGAAALRSEVVGEGRGPCDPRQLIIVAHDVLAVGMTNVAHPASSCAVEDWRGKTRGWRYGGGEGAGAEGLPGEVLVLATLEAAGAAGVLVAIGPGRGGGVPAAATPGAGVQAAAPPAYHGTEPP